jgi:hypothetical protein
VRAAVANSGRSWPSRRVTFALSPAMLPKLGSGFDLADHQPPAVGWTITQACWVAGSRGL